MNAPVAGWYPDPAGSGQQRYWDGVQWTDHLSGPAPWAGQPSPATPQPAGVYPAGYPGVEGYQAAGQQGAGYQEAGYQEAGYQGGPTQPPSGYWTTSARPADPTTVDGVPLASYWSRVGAYLLDGLITQTVATAISWPFLSSAFEWYMHALRQSAGTGTFNSDALQAELTRLMWPVALIFLLVTVSYQVGFLVWRGATLGKMAVGIAVRSLATAARPTLGVALRRQVIQVVSGLSSLVPFASFLVMLLGWLDLLWPAWDRRRQALHDKLAGTVVVRTRLP